MTSNITAFDDLLNLAADPQQLETYRQNEIQSIINQAPEYMRARLQGLQFQIDAHRELHDNSPLGSCLQLSKMMHDSFTKLQDSLNEAAQDTRNTAPLIEENKQGATIIPFPQSRRHHMQA